MAESVPTLKEAAEVAPPTASVDSHVDLPTSKGLSFSEADSITRRGPARVILFTGTAKSGKTTLLPSIYLLFHRQPLAGYLFAGWGTFVGFEERNYYVEIASGLSKPTMERTVRSEVLHLQVRREDLSEPLGELLLCDISAEDFEEAKDSMDACRQMGVIRRADTLVLLVDGAKLVDPASRQRAKNDPLTLLRNCLDGAAQCFDSVHDAVAANRLSYSRWELWFDGVLPSLSWGRNWDKCERLRGGLVRRIVEFEWPATLLSSCTHRPETFNRLLDSCWNVKGAKRALKELRREAENQTSELSDERRALVLRYV